jgi:hypothetical protein
MPDDCSCSQTTAALTIGMATMRSPGSAKLGRAADDRGGGVSAETPMLAMVAEQPVYNDGRFS